MLIEDGRSQEQDLQAVDGRTRLDDCILNIENEDKDENKADSGDAHSAQTPDLSPVEEALEPSSK